MDRQTINVLDDLNALCSEQFDAQVAFAANSKILRKLIMHTFQFRRVRQNLNQKILDESTLKKFAENLISEFTPGTRFPFENTLSAIAVLLEQRKTEFAEEYLVDLARLRLQEFQIATAVAKDCLRNKRASCGDEMRVFAFEDYDSDSDVGDEEIYFDTWSPDSNKHNAIVDLIYA